MMYFRIHTEDVAYLTGQPRGLFTAVGKLADAKELSEEEEREYRKNRAYFERILPVPPFYEKGNPDRATTWFKESEKGRRIFHETSFYRRMLDKYGKKLYLSSCGEAPGEVIYEDDFQIAVKAPAKDAPVRTEALPWPIRQITGEDVPECVRMIRESFKTVASEFGITEENAPRFTAFATDEKKIRWHLEGERRPMYGYFREGKMVGYYSLLEKEGGICELNNLAVIPAFRRRGIGEELLFDSFARARELGAEKMTLGMVEENRALREWYESHGFAHTGAVKYDFFPFTCGYMEKDLRL